MPGLSSYQLRGRDELLIHEVNEADGQPFLALKYVAGGIRRWKGVWVTGFQPGTPPLPPDELVPFEQAAREMDEALCRGLEEAVRLLDSLYEEEDIDGLDDTQERTRV